MKSFAAVALLFAAVSAQSELENELSELENQLLIMEQDGWNPSDDLTKVENATISDIAENVEIMADSQMWNEDYFPMDEGEVEKVLENSGLTWIMSISEDAFAFGEPEWNKQAFDSFISQTDTWLIGQEVNVTDMVRNEVGPMFEPARDFVFTDLGDYLETLDDLNTDFMATEWFESAMSDPFYELSTAQIKETATILAKYGIDVSEQDLTNWQEESKKEAAALGISSMDDLTQDNICNILVQTETIDLSEIQYENCSDITPESVWSKMSVMMKEENNLDLAEMGYRSFDDITEQNVFNTVSSMMEKPMTDYGVASFDDLTADKLITIIEANGGEVTEEQKKQLKENFADVQAGVQAAREQANSALVAAGLVEEPTNNDGAYTMMASMAAVATAVVALAF